MKILKLIFLVSALLFTSISWGMYCPTGQTIKNVVLSSGINVEGNGGYDLYKYTLVNNFGTNAPSTLKIKLLAENTKNAIDVIKSSLSSLRDPILIDPYDSSFICVYHINPPADGKRYDLTAVLYL